MTLPLWAFVVWAVLTVAGLCVLIPRKEVKDD
jgi:hypothetical protein